MATATDEILGGKTKTTEEILAPKKKPTDEILSSKSEHIPSGLELLNPITRLKYMYEGYSRGKSALNSVLNWAFDPNQPGGVEAFKGAAKKGFSEGDTAYLGLSNALHGAGVKSPLLTVPARGLDLGVDIATDPLSYVGDLGMGEAVKGVAGVVAKSPVGHAVAKKAIPVINSMRSNLVLPNLNKNFARMIETFGVPMDRLGQETFKPLQDSYKVLQNTAADIDKNAKQLHDPYALLDSIRKYMNARQYLGNSRQTLEGGREALAKILKEAEEKGVNPKYVEQTSGKLTAEMDKLHSMTAGYSQNPKSGVNVNQFLDGMFGKSLAQVEQQAMRMQGVYAPIQQRLEAIPIIQGSQQFLRKLGFGITAKLRSTIGHEYNVRVENEIQKARDVVSDVMQETERIQRSSPDLNKAFETYASNNHGANPVMELVRSAVNDRMAGAVPWDVMSPKAQEVLKKRYANPYGIDPAFVAKRADDIIAQIKNTESNLIKLGSKREVDSANQHKPIVNVKDWLDGMFGDAPILREKGKSPFTNRNFTAIRETELRSMVDKIPGTDWAKPVINGYVQPGWMEVKDIGGLEKLKGMQIPEPLFDMLNAESVKSGLGHGGSELRNSYIRAIDLATKMEMSGVGTLKRGMLANPSTQIANMTSNDIAARLALTRNGVKISPDVWTKTLYEAQKEVRAFQRNGIRSQSIKSIGEHSNSFLNTMAGQLEKKPGEVSQIADVGRSAKLKEVGRALNPTQGPVAFQGTAERTWKLALFKVLEKKMGAQAAAAQVEKHLFDYSDRNFVMELFDKVGLAPFNTFPAKAFNLLMDTLVHHPEIALKYARARKLAGQGYSNSMQDYRPDWQKGFFEMNTGPNQFANLSRMHPFGDILSTGQNLLNEPDTLKSANQVMRNPIFGAAGDIVAGRSSFADEGNPRPLVNPGAPRSELVNAIGKEAVKQYVPLGRTAISLAESLQGKPSTASKGARAVPFDEAVLHRIFGLRVQDIQEPRERMKERGATISTVAKTNSKFIKEALAKSKAATSNPFDEEVRRMDARQLETKLRDNIKYLRGMPADGTLSAKKAYEGFLLQKALIARHKQLMEIGNGSRTDRLTH